MINNVGRADRMGLEGIFVSRPNLYYCGNVINGVGAHTRVRLFVFATPQSANAASSPCAGEPLKSSAPDMLPSARGAGIFAGK